jgi:hypothetical protein
MVENVPVVIEWHKLFMGSSFYIPALNRQDLIEQVTREAARRKIKLKCRMTFEQDTLGVRFWRVA